MQEVLGLWDTVSECRAITEAGPHLLICAAKLSPVSIHAMTVDCSGDVPRLADLRKYPPLHIETMPKEYVSSIVADKVDGTIHVAVLIKSLYMMYSDQLQGFIRGYILVKEERRWWENNYIFPPEDIAYKIPMTQIFYNPFHMCNYGNGKILFSNAQQNPPDTVKYALNISSLEGNTLHQLLALSLDKGLESDTCLENPAGEVHCKDIILNGYNMLSWNEKKSCLALVNTQTNVIHTWHLKLKKSEICELPSCNITSKQQELKTCAACHEVAYCSKAHQKLHWGQHKPKCGRKTCFWYRF